MDETPLPPGWPSNLRSVPPATPTHQPLPSVNLAPAQGTSLDTLESSVGFSSTPRVHDALLQAQSISSCFRHSGWWRLRRRVAQALVRTNQSESRIRNFCSCGASSWVQVNNANDERFRIQTNTCHDRMCTPCANVRALRIRQVLLQQIAGKPISFMTFTLSGNEPDLTVMVDKLYRSFRYLRSHPIWADSVRGGAAFLEIKWNDKAKRWHPHLHILADADYIPVADLSDAWRTITKDSYIVDVRRVRQENVIASYVVKYATKPLNSTLMCDDKILDDTLHALRGRRLCLCFGSWYGTPLSAAEDEELADDWEDAQGWTNLDPLSLVLERAVNGEPWATQLLDKLNVRDRFRAMCLLDSS